MSHILVFVIAGFIFPLIFVKKCWGLGNLKFLLEYFSEQLLLECLAGSLLFATIGYIFIN